MLGGKSFFPTLVILEHSSTDSFHTLMSHTFCLCTHMYLSGERRRSAVSLRFSWWVVSVDSHRSIYLGRWNYVKSHVWQHRSQHCCPDSLTSASGRIRNHKVMAGNWIASYLLYLLMGLNFFFSHQNSLSVIIRWIHENTRFKIQKIAFFFPTASIHFTTWRKSIIRVSGSSD